MSSGRKLLGRSGGRRESLRNPPPGRRDGGQIMADDGPIDPADAKDPDDRGALPRPDHRPRQSGAAYSNRFAIAMSAAMVRTGSALESLRGNWERGQFSVILFPTGRVPMAARCASPTTVFRSFPPERTRPALGC